MRAAPFGVRPFFCVKTALQTVKPTSGPYIYWLMSKNTLTELFRELETYTKAYEEPGKRGWRDLETARTVLTQHIAQHPEDRGEAIDAFVNFGK